MERKVSKGWTPQEIKAWMKEFFLADDFIGPVEWKGYDVYEPKYKRVSYLFGLNIPIMLVEGDEAREGTFEEGHEFAVYRNKLMGYEDNDDDNIDEPMEKDNTLSGSGE